MAQHRTREDKMKAQMRRSAQQYSLSQLLTTDKKQAIASTSPSPALRSPDIPRKSIQLVSTEHLRLDLLRTAFAFGVVLICIGIAYWRLNG